MTEAVVIALIAASAALVAFIRMRRRKLSPALRREYADLAAWAERETALIRNAYARMGWDAEQDMAEASEFDKQRLSEAGCGKRAVPPLGEPPVPPRQRGYGERNLECFVPVGGRQLCGTATDSSRMPKSARCCGQSDR